MNGVHDMGGMHGFGPVVEEKNEPPFHARWEGRAYALNRAMGMTGVWNIDQSRHSQETLPAHIYLQSTYYDRWMRGLERLLVKNGLATDDELKAGHALHPARPVTNTLKAADVPKIVKRGSYERPAKAPAQFEPGDRVRAKMMHPVGHTRLPRYVRGQLGTIEAIRGCHVYPDSVAAGKGEDPQWLYTVVFAGTDLWGPESDPTLTVSVEAFEPYLERA